MNFKQLSLFTAAAAVSIFCAGCLCTQSCSKTEQKDHLQIGWSKRSIAQNGPVPITGQFYLRISQGEYSPVMAQALVLANQNDAVIFVSCDMVSVNPAVLKKAQAILKKEVPALPAEKIILNATHTHAGPSANVIPTDYPRQAKVILSEEMQNFISRQVADAVKEAWNKRAPGSIAYGYGFATTGHNRRTIYFDDISKRTPEKGLSQNGKGRIYGKTNDPMFDGYEAGTDAFINLLYTFDKKGKLTGAIINVPCPAQTNEHSWQLHAGFWYNVREKLAKKYGDIGVISQSAAAGDLSPRQLHYQKAETRRFMLKYPELTKKYEANPMRRPKPEDNGKNSPWYKRDWLELMRAEDIANRIVSAFDEVLSWAENDKKCTPQLKHQIKTVKLTRQMFPKHLIEKEKEIHKTLMQQKYIEDGNQWDQLFRNSVLRSRRGRVGRLIERYKLQQKEPKLTTVVHAVRIGDIAFASNRFELYMDYMHRIQARSPFEQTFIVQLVTDVHGVGSYLPTEKACSHKGYSAQAYSMQVTPTGGQELVNETLQLLEDVKK